MIRKDGLSPEPILDPITFSATGFPGGTGFSMNGAGVLSGTPTAADATASPFNVTVTATAVDGSANDIVQFTINGAPTLDTPIPDQSGVVDVALSAVDLSGNFSDPDLDPITFSATGFPGGTGLSINGAGVLSGTPAAADATASPFDVTVTATATGGTADGIFTFSISEPPEVDTPIPDQTATLGVAFGPLDVSGNFLDPDLDPMTFSAAGFPGGTGLAISGAGVISGTPTADDVLASPFTITVTATAADGTVDDAFDMTVTSPPEVVGAGIGPQTATEEQPLTLDISGAFVDPDTDPITFTATGLPSSLTMSAAGVITGTPTNDDAFDPLNPFSITVTATAIGRLG